MSVIEIQYILWVLHMALKLALDIKGTLLSCTQWIMWLANKAISCSQSLVCIQSAGLCRGHWIIWCYKVVERHLQQGWPPALQSGISFVFNKNPSLDYILITCIQNKWWKQVWIIEYSMLQFGTGSICTRSDPLYHE